MNNVFAEENLVFKFNHHDLPKPIFEALIDLIQENAKGQMLDDMKDELSFHKIHFPHSGNFKAVLEFGDEPIEIVIDDKADSKDEANIDMQIMQLIDVLGMEYQPYVRH